ncbi:RNA polymerase sigma factor [Proteinivorax hydrogeniformans]|uniref:RNA polymerase sigma factor n=1 Tax=Proteinivorax hydrogeniformans TaxID=1826727 RepID=A0AAU8HRC1_9FIRM
MEKLLEKQIIKGLKNKEEWAADKLLEHYGQNIYALAYKFTKNEHDAKDLTQEILIKVLQKIHKFKGESKLGTWIYRLAYNHCLDFLKTNQKHSEALKNSSTSTEEVPRKANDPHGIMENKEKYLNLFKALEKLEDKYRNIIILKEFRGLTYEQIGKHLDIPEGSVKSSLYRARRKLAKLYLSLEQ